MNSARSHCCASKLIAIFCSCGIGLCDEFESKLRDETFRGISSNTKLGKSLFKVSDKIVIHHYLYGEIEFKGEQLKSLAEKLDKLAHDEWWCTGFLTKGRNGWFVMIECSVKKKDAEGEYEILALIPLNGEVLKNGSMKDIDELLPPAVINKSKK